MNSYKSSAELKALAKEQLFGKYGASVGATVLWALFTLLTTMLPYFLVPFFSTAGIILKYLLAFVLSIFTGIFTSGLAFMSLKITCGQPVSASDIFYGFKANPDKALLIMLVLQTVNYVTSLPSLILNPIARQSGSSALLLLSTVCNITGFVIYILISLNYAQAYFLLHDFPDYSAKELLQMSRHMMKGHKGRLFYIQVSFVPFILLGFLSLGIAFLWIAPYVRVTSVNFYMDLVKNKNKQGNEL